MTEQTLVCINFVIETCKTFASAGLFFCILFSCIDFTLAFLQFFCSKLFFVLPENNFASFIYTLTKVLEQFRIDIRTYLCGKCTS